MSWEELEEAATLHGRAPRPQKPDASGRNATAQRPLHRPATAGDIIADKYRLMRMLGRGGMGRIFEADHLLLDSKVALKFMHPHLARDRAQVSRFQREARAAATLKSEYVARIIDVDQLASGELYIVMEYLEGASLETMATEGRGLPVHDALTYIVQACDALAEAHARSIIHRDVKPANLFLTRGKSGEPIIKVLDFGLAKSLASSEGFSVSTTSSTVAGQALGTPYYMSPEQVTGADVIDGRSDIWAIGATLYELLTGTLAFPGSNAAIVFNHILEGRPTPLRMLRPDVTESVAAIVDGCLRLDMKARFQTVRDLVKALEASLPPALAAQPLPFVAAPLSTDRFMRSSAPPSLVPSLVPSVRGTAVSLVEALSQPEPPVLQQGPTLRQTVLAALAGPMLIAVVAGGVVLKMQTDANESDTPAVVGASKVTYLTAKSGGAVRKKAPAAPAAAEKPERLRR